ncbi:MAG TPA: hypothetical protein VHL59_05710 [Thermoanaerobaculia bacterium]|nr:hypothetical protein [Thermoanaerobaculia bacterium]
MDAMQVTEPGGPERLEYRDILPPEPHSGQVPVRIEAIGVNFLDVHHRAANCGGAQERSWRKWPQAD